jgi:hypothetical protein
MGHNRIARTSSLDRGCLIVGLVFSWICVVAATGGVAGQLNVTSNGAGPQGVVRCLEFEPKAERLPCYEQTASAQPQDSGAWRLVRSLDPRGGPDAVSIMHTTELSKSDPDIAGLMLRCAGVGVEALVIVIEPRPPRARPRISIGALGANSTFDATVVPPFSALLLPKDAAALLAGPWQSAPELSIRIDGDQATVRGIVLLAGLRPAMDRLMENCASQ